MEAPLITLTPNPALDLSGTVEHLKPGHKLRCRDERRDPGGGGINVARVLKRFGADPVAVFPARGLTGGLLEQSLAAEGLRCDVVHMAGETRQNVTIDEAASGQQYRLVFPGGHAAPGDADALLKAAETHLRPGAWLVASGSLAAGMDDDTYARVGMMVRARQAHLVLDAGGAPMHKALAHTYLLKLSQSELEDAQGAPLTDRDRCVAAARLLLACGPRLIAVTRGASGALLVSRDFALEASAPPIIPKSTVGAGDSFLAAFVWGVCTGRTSADALACAVAAGTAALLEPGTELARADRAARLAPQVMVKSMAEAERKLAGGV